MPQDGDALRLSVAAMFVCLNLAFIVTELLETGHIPAIGEADFNSTTNKTLDRK